MLARLWGNTSKRAQLLRAIGLFCMRAALVYIWATRELACQLVANKLATTTIIIIAFVIYILSASNNDSWSLSGYLLFAARPQYSNYPLIDFRVDLCNELTFTSNFWHSQLWEVAKAIAAKITLKLESCQRASKSKWFNLLLAVVLAITHNEKTLRIASQGRVFLPRSLNVKLSNFERVSKTFNLWVQLRKSIGPTTLV